MVGFGDLTSQGNVPKPAVLIGSRAEWSERNPALYFAVAITDCTSFIIFRILDVRRLVFVFLPWI